MWSVKYAVRNGPLPGAVFWTTMLIFSCSIYTNCAQPISITNFQRRHISDHFEHDNKFYKVHSASDMGGLDDIHCKLYEMTRM